MIDPEIFAARRLPPWPSTQLSTSGCEPGFWELWMPGASEHIEAVWIVRWNHLPTLITIMNKNWGQRTINASAQPTPIVIWHNVFSARPRRQKTEEFCALLQMQLKPNNNSYTRVLQLVECTKHSVVLALLKSLAAAISISLPQRTIKIMLLRWIIRAKNWYWLFRETPQQKRVQLIRLISHNFVC